MAVKSFFHLAVFLVVSSAFASEDTVRASSFGWTADDATECLTRALYSGARKIIIDRQASDWIVRPIVVTNAFTGEIVVEDGVVVRAKRGEFKDRGAALFYFHQAHDAVLRGEGKARFVMNKRDYQDPDRYAFSEWRHTLAVNNCRNFTVRDLTLESSGGDGVYVNNASENVTLERLVCRDHHRQGISVISALGLHVRNCVFSETGGAAPQCGIDIEPNGPANRVEDCVFEDCVFENNAASGINLHLPTLSDKTNPISIVFRRCLSRNNRSQGFAVYLASTYQPPVRGSILFEDCRAYGNGGSPLFVKNATPVGVQLVFRNCEFDGRETAATTIDLGGDMPMTFEGVRFENCKAFIGSGKGIDYVGISGAGITGLEGSIDFERKGKSRRLDLAKWAEQFPTDYELLKFETTGIDFRKLRPMFPTGEAKAVRTGHFRNTMTFVQRVPAAGDYPIAFDLRRINPIQQANGEFRLRDAHGTDRGVVKLPEGESTYVLKATGAGLYRFEIRCKGMVEVSSALPGCGVKLDEETHLFGGSDRNWHFVVPKGSRKVCVSVTPQERCSAELVSPDGRVVDSLPYSRRAAYLQTKTEPLPEDQVWCVRFPQVEEDAYFRIGAPAIPVASTDPALVLRSE